MRSLATRPACQFSWLAPPTLLFLAVVACDNGTAPPIAILHGTGGQGGGHTAGGSLAIAATMNRCPTLVVAIAPPEAAVGGQIDVRAAASDPDVGARLTYQWSAGAGSFADARADHSTYTCTTPGPQTITLSVSDGSCTVLRRTPVSCQVGQTASASGGAAPASPAGAGGMAGVAPPPSGTAAGAGGAGAASTPPAGGARPAACTVDPTHDEGVACEACTRDNCNPATDGCDLLPSDAKKELCKALYCCIRANHCANAGDPTRCFCGTAPSGGDQACYRDRGAANGPCAAEFLAAAESKDPSVLRLLFVNPDFAIGRAVNLSICRGSYCGSSDRIATAGLCQ